MKELSPCVCMSASIWINIHSELMIIITRVLLENFGLKNTFLMKKIPSEINILHDAFSSGAGFFLYFNLCSSA